MKSYKDIVEALKGKQHKLDVDKDGKIEGEDLAKLRSMKKEEVEPIEEKKTPEATGGLKDACWKGYTAVGMKMKNGKKVPNCVPVKEEKDEEEDREARSDYKLSPSGRKTHKEIVFKHGEEKKEGLDEVAPPGFEGTVKAMKKHKEIDNPYALAWYMKNKGMKSHKKADGTMKEEIEELDEKSDQAKQNKTMKNMMDASRGARFKLNNPVPDAEPQHKTAQAHNKAIGRALRKEDADQVEEGYYEKPASAYRRKGDEIGGGSSKNDVPFDGPYTKTSGSTTDKSGAVHSPMSKVRHLARMAMKKQMKEQFQLDITDEQADTILDAINEQAPVAPVPGDKWKSHAVMVNGKQRVVIKRSNAKNYPEHEGWKEVSPGQKIKEDDEVKFSYKELMMMLEVEFDKSGRYVHKGTYGTEFAKKEREKDEKGFDADDKPTTNLTKRGRGRPAGSKSGARGPRIK